MNDKLTKGVVVIAFLLILPAALAVNLDFTINLPKTSYYSNETIPVNISIVNRDITSAAKNLSLIILAGQRNYSYSLGDLNPSQSTIKSLTLPEFAPGTYTIRGILNYNWLFDEIFTTESYNSFDVKFPDVKNLPRNVYIKRFDLPDNITSGKKYNSSVDVVNNGTIPTDLLIEIEFLNESVTQNLHLEPNEMKTVQIVTSFTNPGISIIEARLYAIVDEVKYFINYLSKNIVVKESKSAKLSLDKIELNTENNKMSQNGEVEIKIYVKNVGDGYATNVKGILFFNESSIIITKSITDYKLILNKESAYSEPYKIRAISTPVGTYNLTLYVNFVDSMGTHTINFVIPVDVEKEKCSNDNQCASNEGCSNRQCVELNCGKEAYPQNHQCLKYECTKDSDCKTNEYCDIQIHSCKRKVCIDIVNNGDPKDKLDIVFVGDNYTDLNQFEADAKTHTNKILETEPFKGNKNKINVHLVDKIENLNCRVHGDRCAVCDDRKVSESAALCPNDKTIVLYNTDKWAGCASLYGTAVASSRYPFISLHEFGHSFGGLWDEYSYGGNGYDTNSPNCDSSSSCSKWSNVSNSGCFLGCTFDNLYRSIDNGIMRTVSDHFGAVDYIQLFRLLNFYK